MRRTGEFRYTHLRPSLREMLYCLIRTIYFVCGIRNARVADTRIRFLDTHDLVFFRHPAAVWSDSVFPVRRRFPHYALSALLLPTICLRAFRIYAKGYSPQLYLPTTSPHGVHSHPRCHLRSEILPHLKRT